MGVALGPIVLNPRRRRGIAAGGGRAGVPVRPAPLTGAACVCICSRNPGGDITHRERHGRGRVSGAGAAGGGGRRGRVSAGRAAPCRALQLLPRGPCHGAAAFFLLGRGSVLGVGHGCGVAVCRASPLGGAARREHSWPACLEDLIS